MPGLILVSPFRLSGIDRYWEYKGCEDHVSWLRTRLITTENRDPIFVPAISSQNDIIPSQFIRSLSRLAFSASLHNRNLMQVCCNHHQTASRIDSMPTLARKLTRSRLRSLLYWFEVCLHFKVSILHPLLTYILETGLLGFLRLRHAQ